MTYMESDETQPSVSGKKLPSQRHYLAAFFFSFMWGSFAVDRFYMGKIGTGILKLLTLGGFGVWTLIDFVLISSGVMKDKQGRPMLQVAEYKKFAGRTILWFAIILGLVILISGIALIQAAFTVYSMAQSGELTNQLLDSGAFSDLINSFSGINPADLQNLQDATSSGGFDVNNLTPEQQQSLQSYGF